MNSVLRLFCGFIDAFNAIKRQLDERRTRLKANKVNSSNADVLTHALVNVATICAKSCFPFLMEKEFTLSI